MAPNSIYAKLSLPECPRKPGFLSLVDAERAGLGQFFVKNRGLYGVISQILRLLTDDLCLKIIRKILEFLDFTWFDDLKMPGSFARILPGGFALKQIWQAYAADKSTKKARIFFNETFK